MFRLRLDRTYLRFSAGNGPISLLIQAKTACRWSHVDFLMPDRKLLGALPGGGVQERSIIRGETRFAIYEVQISWGYEWALKQIGKPYDWGAVLALASLFPIKRNWMDEKYWFCSELVCASLLHAGLPIFSEEAWGITPRDLLISGFLRPTETFINRSV